MIVDKYRRTAGCVDQLHGPICLKSLNYQLDGEFSYNIKSLNAYRANSWFGEMDCSVELTGGKVETLEFSFLIGENGGIEEYFICANDMDLDLDKPNSTIDILERFKCKMPG